MPPQQIANVSGPNQYDFIVNYNHQQGNNWLLQAPLKTRIIIFCGGLLVLLLLIWIFIALLSASASGSAQTFTALAQEQAELARISNLTALNAGSAATQNIASTVQLSLLTDERTFVNYLTAINAAPSASTLARGTNAQIDAELTNAQASGTFDQTYTSVASRGLSTYASNLKKAFNSTGNATERQLLSDAYQNAQLLLTLSSPST